MFRILTVATLFCFLALSSALAAPITSNTDPALLGATVIDFESQTIGTSIGYTIGDVTFSNAGTGSLRIDSYTTGGTFGTSGLELSTRDADGSFYIEFANPVSAFGMIWGAADGSWEMNILDSSNVLVEAISIPAQTTPYIGYIGASGVDIARAELVGSYADWVKIDDFAYVNGSAPVPEPATLLLLGSGLAGLAFYRRKRK